MAAVSAGAASSAVKLPAARQASLLGRTFSSFAIPSLIDSTAAPRANCAAASASVSASAAGSPACHSRRTAWLSRFAHSWRACFPTSPAARSTSSSTSASRSASMARRKDGFAEGAIAVRHCNVKSGVRRQKSEAGGGKSEVRRQKSEAYNADTREFCSGPPPMPGCHHSDFRSEEHTSELQSLRHLVCRLLLEKKKT